MLSLNQEQYSNTNSLQICGCDNNTQNHKSKNITKPYNQLKTGIFFLDCMLSTLKLLWQSRKMWSLFGKPVELFQNNHIKLSYMKLKISVPKIEVA